MVVVGLPLSTKDRWIVDEKQFRVKLACVSWPSHLGTLVPEGLHKKPLDVLSKKITSLGFNCVRLTWPVAMVTNSSYFTLTVESSFKNLRLNQGFSGIKANNPQFLKLTVIQAFQTVVQNLGHNKVMVILDNHISMPGWCCSRTDGNGFFGDQYFDPQVWIQALTKMAIMFKSTKNVVGMSLRNELRGMKQNIPDWYRYMTEGAEAVHRANQNVLVILSGLEFDINLGFLNSHPVKLSFTGKLVFEVHQYSFSMGDAWIRGNPNDVCGSFQDGFWGNAGYLLQRGFPLFISEFGGDLRETNVGDNRYFPCMFGVLADLDLDWAWWSFQGSYYWRDNLQDPEEVYGVVDKNWNEIRNPKFMEKIYAIQIQHQGPSNHDKGPYQMMFHPLSGLCINATYLSDPIRLASCKDAEKWEYTPEKAIMVKYSQFCLQAVGLDMSPRLATDCNVKPNAKWEKISNSGMHISTTLENGVRVCLDADKNGLLITSACKCLGGDINCEPASQWFKIIKHHLYIN
ncbi:hypothetical protein AQUCO_01100428v1 [Aquilegia coerulea]|uniref:Uncharacterized protein n=1 Tax=Aquilegia coerulea TaxID=218851 RepID=A0A2G5E738_AQUCA|nr:hypothetical protein AQUCO_01100428v1 [Aquilegia coerulea]